MRLTDEQDTFIQKVQKEYNNLVLDAKAGAGKTFSLVEASKHLDSSERTIALAFNKNIATELQERMPGFVQCMTFNSLGHRAWQQFIGSKRLTVTSNKIGQIVKAVCRDRPELWDHWIEISDIVQKAKREGLVSAGAPGKFKPVIKDNTQAWVEYMESYSLSPRSLGSVQQAQALFEGILLTSIQQAFEGEIDFDDQIYFPALWSVPLAKYDNIIWDECFTGDTLVDTPTGPKQICSLAANDIVCNATGLGTIQRVFVNKTDTLITVGLSNGKKITCTENHPFFTERGWQPANCLETGTIVFRKEDLSAMRECFYTKVRVGGNKNKSDSEKLLGETDILYELLLQEAHESNEAEMGAGESTSIPVKDRTQTTNPWRQRTTNARASSQTIKSIGRWLAARVCGPDWGRSSESRGAVHALQNRYSPSKINDGDRGGRGESQQSEKKDTRSKKNPVVGAIRVVSVQSEKQKSPRVVYNLHITGHPSYYANGILVHNCQDGSYLQYMMVSKMMDDSTRLILAGDENQSIYAWRGASTTLMREMIDKYSCERLPLTISFRCPRSVIREAQKYVPGIRAADTAGEGEVKTLLDWSPETIEPDAVVLCRNVAPLVRCTYRLIGSGRPAIMLGRDIGRSLGNLVKKIISPAKQLTLGQFIEKLEDWRINEIQIARAKGNPNWEESVNDKADSLYAVQRYTGARHTEELLRGIGQIFSDDANGRILLSTIHRAKGREWGTVYFLDEWRIPSKYAKEDAKNNPGSVMMQQEHNLAYVAVTRAKQKLIYIDSKNYKGPDAEEGLGEQLVAIEDRRSA